jgi:hypothetical protein
MFRKLLDNAQAGENVGLLLRGTKREDVERGQVVVKPGSITPHTEFEANVYILSKDEGGRHTPFYNNYRPQFYFRTTDVTGVVHLPEGTEMVMPGDNTAMRVEMIQPIAMEEACCSPSARVVEAARVASPRSSSRPFRGRAGCPAPGPIRPRAPCDARVTGRRNRAGAPCPDWSGATSSTLDRLSGRMAHGGQSGRHVHTDERAPVTGARGG